MTNHDSGTAQAHQHSAEKDVLGPFAEAHDFTCSACGRVGGRVGVDDDEWQQVGDALICAPCVLPPGVGA